MAYHRASLIDLYLHTKFHSNWKLFVDRRTYIRTDAQTDIEAGFIRLGRLEGVDL